MSQWMKYYFYVKNLAVVAEDEEGQGMVEYAIIVVAIAVVAAAAVILLGDQITAFLNGIDFADYVPAPG